MNLATTALAEFWDSDGKILFLGMWCLPYDRRQRDAARDYEVLACPWDDRQRFARACTYVGEVYERVLHHLSGALDRIHAVNLGHRYWERLLGFWLMQLVHTYYNAYCHLKDALSRYPDLHSLVPNEAALQPTFDTTGAIPRASMDCYQLLLMSRIMARLPMTLTPVDFDQELFAGLTANDETAAAAPQSPRLLATCARRLWGKRAVLLRNLPMPRSARHRLMLSSCARVSSWTPSSSWQFARQSPRHEARPQLAQAAATDEFESIFLAALPDELPQLFLEYFQQARAEARKEALPAAAVVSATGWAYDDRFKICAAEMALHGTRLVEVQHGGGFGIDRDVPSERMGRRNADVLVTWGWDEPSQQDLQPAPRLPLSEPAGGQPNGEATILYVATAQQGYAYRFQQGPLGSQWELYFARQQQFMALLTASVRQALRYRGYPHDCGMHQVARIRDFGDDIAIDANPTITASYASAKLVVIDHLQTTVLDTLALNLPTVIIYNPQWQEFRAAAQPFIDLLITAGILQASPQAAAEHVNAIAADPESWWRSEPVQSARAAFSRQYTWLDPNWLAVWGRLLRQW